MTFNQIKNLGGMVKNGEKSTPVIAHIREFRHYNGYKLQDHEVEDMGGLEAARKLGFDEKAYNVLHKVFNVDQTQGLPQQFYEVKSVDFPGLFKRDELAEKLIKNTGAAIEYSVSNRAFYSPISDTIQMPVHEQFKGQEPFYETVLHELGHWTGHKSRLDRLDKINSPKGHAKEELVAELTSTFLCAELGFSKPISNNVSYIQSWMKELENDKRLVVKAAREAEIASAYVWELHRQKELDNDRSKDKEAEQVAPAPEATGMGNYTVEPRGRLFSENYSLYLHQKELARKEVKALSRDER
jgi:antirestriction protein ArdC